MRAPPTRQQTAVTATLPAPIGGWNARDSLAAMPETDAFLLDNWEPLTDRVKVRNGYAAHATLSGITGDPNTLAVWNGPSTSVLWAFAADTAPHAFDASAAGTVSANAAFDGLSHTGTNSSYASVMFNNVAGYYLYLCDELGVNTPAHYNGTTWATPALTGATAASLVHVNLFKYRLWFVYKNSLDLYYLPTDALAGALTKFPLGGYFNKGGTVLATGTWTVDAGEGMDDRLVIVTSRGQIAVFEGTDPSSASSFALVGVYDCALPVGFQRCLFRYGADLFVLTQDGVFPIADILGASAQSPAMPITDKIRSAFNNSARTFGDERGWRAFYYPRGSKIIVNVPQYLSSTSASVRPMAQYVQNAQTKAWCRWTGQYAREWAVYGSNAYFTQRGGYVRKADAQQKDGSTAILATAKQAYNYFGARGQQKYFLMHRPTFECDGAATAVNATIDTDYRTSYRVPGSSVVSGQSATWDVSPWDTTPWDADATISNEWRTFGGIGYCASLQCVASVNGANLSWFATDWVFELGGVL